jgi:predicted nicotinamide N-methyase
MPFAERAAGRGAAVLFGDPGRGYASDHPLRTVATYRLRTMGSAEDAQNEQTSVLTFAGPQAGPGRRSAPGGGLAAPTHRSH